MLVFIAIVLLLLIPLLMLILRLIRWKYAPQWLIAVTGMSAVWLILLVTHSNLPLSISYISWEPITLFPASPTLLVDEVSWTFSLALAALGLSLVLTAVARMDQNGAPQEESSMANIELAASRITTSSWQTWAGSLLIIGMGLVAVQSGNILTVLLAWAIIDIVELAILLTQVNDSYGRESAVISFFTHMLGIGVLILAEIQIWHTGGNLSLSSISPKATIFLLIAAGLRLGVLPLYLPIFQETTLRRGTGTILRVVPAAASLSLLARAGISGVGSPTSTYIISLCAFTAFVGAALWALAPDELNGRPYWLLATAAFATAAAVYGQPQACLSWGITSLLAGGLVFFSSIRHPKLVIIAVFGFLCLSGLPFTPNWKGTEIYTSSLSNPIPTASLLLNVCFLVAHALLLAGYLRHSTRSTALAGENLRDPRVERWIWIVYPAGLIILAATHFLVSFLTRSDIQTKPSAAYFGGLVAPAIGISIWYISNHAKPWQATKTIIEIKRIPVALLSFSSIYQPARYLYGIIQRLLALIHNLLEGDGGILWAIVLFFFILMFIQR